jgi:polysaccharide pyruvyl transferase WcaK-like protein
MRYDKQLKNYHITKLSDKISKILTGMKDWQVLLIPCMPDDLPVIYELYDQIIRKSSQINRIFLIENFSDFTIPQQAGILTSCEVMIGMRYHSLLVPIANGKPVFGLIYDQKVKSLIDLASQVGVSFKDDFEQPWNYFWQNMQYSSNMAKQCAGKMKKIHEINIKLLETLINS